MLLNLYYVLTFELNKLTFKLNKLNFKTLSKLVAIYLECYQHVSTTNGLIGI